MMSLRVLSLCALLIALPINRALASQCNPCGDKCSECEFGYKYSKSCEANVCYKAPGDECGPTDDKERLCAEGLYCSNDVCQGCVVLPDLPKPRCHMKLRPATRKPRLSRFF